MRYHEIFFEAPIADLQMVHTPDSGPPPAGKLNKAQFSNADFGILQSPKGRVKIYKAFEKTPFVFNFYIISANRAYSDSCSEKSLEQYLGDTGSVK